MSGQRRGKGESRWLNPLDGVGLYVVTWIPWDWGGCGDVMEERTG